MGDISNEPSMEDILSSIKRIIADEGDAAVAGARTRLASRPRAEPEVAASEPEEVLELTEAAEPAAQPEPETMDDEPERAEPELVSHNAAAASRQSLASLSAMVVKPELPANTLEGLVRDMLKPMLKDWLDANLPELVEKLVSKEIARISGKGF